MEVENSHILRCFADNDDNLLIYQISASHDNKTDLKLDFSYKIDKAHDGEVKYHQIIDVKPHNKLTIVTGGLDKSVKLFEVNDAKEHKLITTIKHLKKVDFGHWDQNEKKLLFSDKTGDIYETILANNEFSKPVLTHANMATLMSFEVMNISGTKLSETLNTENLLVYTDEYNRMKVLKYPETSHLLAFFSPYTVVFKQVLNMNPHCLVALFIDGTIDFVDFEAIVPSIYSATQLAVKEEFGDKKVFKICKVDADRFLRIDEYFVEINVLKIKGFTVSEKKTINLSEEKLIDSSKKYYANRDVEVVTINGKKYVALIYENEVESKTEGAKSEEPVTKSKYKRFRLSDRVEIMLIDL